MQLKSKFHFLLFLILWSCGYGQLSVICDTPIHLKEISAVEYDAKRDLFWVIQDSGNSNELLGINPNGQIVKTLKLKDTKNKDWEDLTKDKEGNIYIGEFGNNNKSRSNYKIYKINEKDLDKKKAEPDVIEFKLPKDSDEQDFEAFFLWKDYFYLFSKDHKKTLLYRVPKKKGKHTAKKLQTHEFKGKNNKITSAAISSNGKLVVLLTGNKLWKLSKFDDEQFFSGNVEAMEFNHDSQKEGIGFMNSKELVISDERNGLDGGNLYRFKLR